jgi:hypothetical protein
MGGFQSQCGGCGEQKDLSILQEIETKSFDQPVSIYFFTYLWISVAQTAFRETIRQLLNYESERMWKEAVVANLRCSSGIFL